MPDARSLHHCLKNKLLKLNSFSCKDPDTHAALKVLHLLYFNPASARLTIGLLMFNALIQLKIIQY